MTTGVARPIPMTCRFLADDSGATAIEYSIVAAGIGLAVASAVWGLGSQITATFYNKLINLF